jgi:hypothetical protein
MKSSIKTLVDSGYSISYPGFTLQSTNSNYEVTYQDYVTQIAYYKSYNDAYNKFLNKKEKNMTLSTTKVSQFEWWVMFIVHNWIAHFMLPFGKFAEKLHLDFITKFVNDFHEQTYLE